MTSQPLVCLFPGQLQLGGVGRNTLNLAEALLDRGVRVDLFLSSRAGAYISQIPDRARVFEGRGGSIKATIPSLVTYLRRERPHMLVSARQYINIAAIVARLLARVPTVVVVTERTTAVAGEEHHTGRRRPFMRIGVKLLYPLADRIVAVSEAVADDLARSTGIDRSRIQVIHNPVVTQRIDALRKDVPDDPWLRDSGSPLVLGVGRLTAAKDFHTLIRAFAQIRQSLNARLMIIGEGEERQSLELLVQELGLSEHVALPGYIENPYAYMARASVFVLSSRWEGLPSALIEALATGTPVVATDCPGGSREVLLDGLIGPLVGVEDATGLATAVLHVLSDPPEPARLRARALDFSAERAAERYLGLLGTVADLSTPVLDVVRL